MKTKLSFYISAFLFLALIAGLVMPVQMVRADTVIVYDATSNLLPPNIPSLGFQATQTSEFGDYVHLAGTNRALRTVTVTMSDWALYSDYSSDIRYMGNNVTWSHPITANIYSNHLGANGVPDTLLGTMTQTFQIPWRPAADPTCSGGTAWRAGDGSCYNGFAFNITFDMSSLNVALPNDIIVSVTYNTQTWGAAPLVVAGPYNSLNVGVLGTATVGADDNTDRVFWNTLTASNYTDGGIGGVGTFRDDAGWTPNGTVNIQITAAPLPVHNVTQDTFYLTIQSAINAANPGDTINVAAGTYIETGQIVINKNLTIIGADKTTTIIKPAQDTGVSGDDRGWFLVNSGVTFNLSNVTLDGAGRLMNIAINSHGSGTINNNIIQNMGYNPSGPDYAGRAIALWDANMTVSNNTIQNFGRIGIYVGSGVTAAVIDGNTIIGKGDGNHLDYGVELGRGGVAEVKNNTISNCRGVAIDTSTSAALLITTYFNPGTSANVHDNIFSNNTAGIVVGYDAFDTSSVTAHHNQFLGNDEGISSTAPVVDAENNWWGVASGPATGVIIGNVDFTPWCADSACTSLPPEMPSSFLGTIYNPAFAGKVIEAYIADSLITSVAITGTGPLTYAFDVPSDLLGTLPTKEGGVEGDVITFKIDGQIVGSGVWHSGTNVELNFAMVTLSNFNQTYTGLPTSASATTNPLGLMVNFTYDDSSVVPTNAGSYAVVANITTPKYAGMASGTLVIAKASSTTTLSGGGTFVYNGLSHPATVSVTGAGGLNQTPLPVYEGNCSAAPVNVLETTPCTASYTYPGDANHEASTGSTTIVITPAAGTVSLGNLSQVFNESPRSVSYTTIPAGLNVDITYGGSATAPTNAGSYAVVATINDPNSAAGTANGTLVIGKATAMLTLSNLTQANNGTPRSVTVTTVPSGLSVVITYDGSTTAPTNAGSYAVIATINELNYAGTASGTLVITPATHSIALVPGWNLISFNLSPTNTAVTNVLSSIAGKYNLVYAWDASVASSNWKKYDPTAPFGNNLLNLDEKMGFWIHMTTAGTLDVVGNVPAATTINLSTTAGGWNLVAYPSANGSLSPASIGGANVSLVYAYHANDISDPWKLYDQSAPSWSNDLTVLAPGWGYWVKVIAPQTWNVPY